MRWLSIVFVLAVLSLFASPALAAPQRTTIGVYVVQVNSIDLKSNAFTVDFWLWFRGAPRTTSPIDAFEVIDGRVLSKTNVIKKTLPDGQAYAAARVSVTIHRQWDLRRYPFDDHDLEIVIEDQDLDTTESVYVSDATSQGKDPDVQVAGWDIEGFATRVEDHGYGSNYGDTSMAAGADARFSRFIAKLPARRHGVGRFLKIAFPLLVSVFIAWCAFFIRPKDAGPRVAVSVGALFAAAAGTVAINSQLPDINYATTTDRTVFLSLGMISLSLLSTVAALGFHYLENVPMHRRVDRAGALAFPVIYALLLVFVVR